jgi:hypothetical protein
MVDQPGHIADRTRLRSRDRTPARQSPQASPIYRRIGLEPVTVSGSGVGSGSALVNNGTNDIFGSCVVLTGNTVFGGAMR